MARNNRQGVFELSKEQADYWFHGGTPLDWEADEKVEFYVVVFELYGLKVLDYSPNHLSVKASPDQVWRILTGNTLDWEKPFLH